MLGVKLWKNKFKSVKVRCIDSHSTGNYRIGTATGPWAFLKDDDIEKDVPVFVIQ